MTSKDPVQPKAFYDSVILSFPLISWMEEKKYYENLAARDKDNYQLPSWSKLT